MNVTQRISNIATAVALITLSLSTNAVAETQTVTRGPNGAASIVKKVPLDAQQRPSTEPRNALSVTNQGPNGAAHIANTESTPKSATTPASRIITRGPNGAAFIAR